MTHSQACTTLVAGFEGFKPVAYQDGNGIWTIGYGRIGNVQPGDTCTEAQALQWLSEDLGTADEAVNRLVTASLTQNEFDALVSLTYNIGQGNFASSTCCRLINQGQPAQGIESIAYYENDAWHGWVFVAGRVSAGLLRRRQTEQALFNQAVTS
jgi:lysozyme